MENINDYMPLSNDWNKERLETLKKLFPDLFTNEGKLNINELKKVVEPESVSETERYEFRWFGKSAAKRNAFSPSNATLVYDETRSVNPSDTENLIIEGENLEVLKLLSTAYREKIKCIYIDPPYNTGKDFVYSDNYSQDKKAYWEDAGIVEEGLKIDTNTETDGRYHSNWLNMMYSRLLIARQLLREDGVIFISIDDNEVHHLRKLCDEIFGEENFIGFLKWKRKKQPSYLHGHIASVMEYVVIYSKSKECLEKLSIEKRTDANTRIDNASNSVSERIIKKGVRVKLPQDITEIPAGVYKNKTMETEFLDSVKINNGRTTNDFRAIAKFRNEQTVIDNFVENDVFFITKNYGFRRDLLPEELERRKAITDLLLEWGDNQDSDNEMNILFPEGKPFEYSKPTLLIENLVSSINSEGEIILDFFAGSGSTGHALFNIANNKNGNRKFILVQIPEKVDETTEAGQSAINLGLKTISDITIERNKRVIKQIQLENSNKKDDLFSENDKKKDKSDLFGFKVFKLVKSNFPRVEFAPDPEKTTEENIELLKKYISEKEAQLISMFNEKELVTEVLIKNGFLLNYTLTKQEEFKKNKILFATDGEKETLICLDILIDNETVEHFKKNTDKKFICLERALDTTKKWNLKHYLGDKFKAF